MQAKKLLTELINSRKENNIYGDEETIISDDLKSALIDYLSKQAKDVADWISIEDDLPKNKAGVLGLTNTGRILITWIYPDTNVFDDQDINESEHFTHWMPLPRKPSPQPLQSIVIPPPTTTNITQWSIIDLGKRDFLRHAFDAKPVVLYGKSEKQVYEWLDKHGKDFGWTMQGISFFKWDNDTIQAQGSTISPASGTE
jgi:hypothetical protein